jgi:hypothetical protein
MRVVPGVEGVDLSKGLHPTRDARER